MSEIRKQKNKQREKLTWAPPCAAQPAGRPSPPPSSVVFILDRGRGVWPARARAPAPRHQLACLRAPVYYTNLRAHQPELHL